jgi:hypothetical protein
MPREPAGFDQGHHVQNDRGAECDQSWAEDGTAFTKSDLDGVKESNGIQRNRSAQPEDTHLLH